MATFWTEAEIDLDVNEIYENLSDREILKLVEQINSQYGNYINLSWK